MRKCCWIFVVVIFLAGVCPAQRASRNSTKASRSAYSQLDNEQLAGELASLGMVELLQSLQTELGEGIKTISGRRLIVQTLVTQAQAAQDPDKRDKLLDKAITVQRGIAAELGKVKKPTPTQELQLLRSRLRLAELIGQYRAEPYALRCMYLQGSQADRLELARLTKQASKLLAEVNATIRKKLQDWNLQLKVYVKVGPSAEQLQQESRYRSGWVYFHQAMSMAPGEAKSILLNRAISAVESYALDDSDEFGVRDWSLLLMGMSFREMGEYDKAAGYLSRAASARSSGANLHLQAKFELARNLIECGRALCTADPKAPKEGQAKFDQAVKAVEDFKKTGYKEGKDWQLVTDIKRAMLLNYLYETRAECTAEPKKKKQYRAEAQKPFYELLKTHTEPDVQLYIFDTIAMKYRGDKDAERLSTVVQMSLAMLELSREDAKSIKKADELLGKVLSQNDEASRSLHPLALWKRAFLRNSQRDNRGAAGMFIQLARDFPKHKYAYRAALYAVQSYYGVIEERRRSRELIAPGLRKGFVAAMELLLGNSDWSAKPEAFKWYFDLGWQYEKLAESAESDKQKYEALKKAIAAYNKVPANQVNYMAARNFSLGIEVQLLDTLDAAKADTVGRKVIARLKKYSAEAQRRSDAMAAAGNKAQAEELCNWAASAAFNAAKVRYEKLGQKQVALKELAEVQQNKKWAQTTVAPMVAEYRIRKLVEDERTDEAINEVEKFRKQYPRMAQELIQLVVEQIQTRIAELKDDPARQDALSKYKQVYLSFSKLMYERSEQRKLPIEQMIPVKRMLADALLVAGGEANVNKAKAMIEECVKYEQKQRAAAYKVIEEATAKQLAAAKAAHGNFDKLLSRAEAYSGMLRNEGIDAKSISSARAVQFAIEIYKKLIKDIENETNPKEHEKLLAQKPKALQQVYDSLVAAIRTHEKKVKASVPMDANNLHLQARIQRGLKQYKKAVDTYNKLVGGIDKNRHEKLYWSLQLELCECTLEGFSKDKDIMEKLRVKIRQLMEIEADGGNMGGLRKKYLEIRRRVEAIGK